MASKLLTPLKDALAAATPPAVAFTAAGRDSLPIRGTCPEAQDNVDPDSSAGQRFAIVGPSSNLIFTGTMSSPPSVVKSTVAAPLTTPLIRTRWRMPRGSTSY